MCRYLDKHYPISVGETNTVLAKKYGNSLQTALTVTVGILRCYIFSETGNGFIFRLKLINHSIGENNGMFNL